MRRVVGGGCWIVLVVVLVAAPVSAWDRAPFGIRAMGMGGAFTAVADDATAVEWNPAGLAMLSGWGVGWTGYRAEEDVESVEEALGDLWANPPGDESVYGDEARAGVVRAALERLARQRLLAREEEAMELGLVGRSFALTMGQWRRSFVFPSSIDLEHTAAVPPGEEGSLADNESRVRRLDLDRTEYCISAAYGGENGQTLLGATLRYQRWEVTEAWGAPWEIGAAPSWEEILDALDGGVEQRSSTWAMDVGLLLNMGYNRLGLMARNVTRPEIELPGGGKMQLDRAYRLGYAFLPSPTLIVGLDYDLRESSLPEESWTSRQVAFGFEKWFGETRTLALRGGGRRDLAWDASRIVYSLGLGVRFGPLQLAAAAEMDSDSLRQAATFQLGLRL
jgi:hypothetical protein